MPGLDVSGVTKRFGEREVLRGLDLNVRPGQTYGLLGSNGAGKTTAMNIITGLLDQDEGTVTLDGAPLDADARAVVGVVPQEVALYHHLTCRENLRFFGSIYRLRGTALGRRVDAVIELCQLDEYADTPVSSLSGGWRHRVNIAVGMVHQPKVLLLDEPTTGQDIEARYRLWSVIRSLRDQGTAVLLSTHMMEEAEAVCDRVGILHQGRIEREGTLDELYATIPAAEMAEVETDDPSALERRAGELGLGLRRYGGKLTVLLPERSTLSDVVARLGRVPIRSLALRPVALQHVFFDVVGSRV